MLSVAALAGCNKQSNGAGIGPLAANAATTSAAVSSFRGPFPRGQVVQAGQDPAKAGPALDVSPARGLQSQSPTVDIAIKADDPDGVASVKIGGVPATKDAAGRWSSRVALTPGLNVIPYEATDAKGNARSGYASVTQGRLVADDQRLEKSIGVSLAPAALARVADIAAQQVAQRVSLLDLIKQHNPLLDRSYLKLTATGLKHDPIAFRIHGATSGLTIVAELGNVTLDAEGKAPLFGTVPLEITATKASAFIAATIDPASFGSSAWGLQRALGMKIDRIDVTLQGFAARAKGGFTNAIVSKFQGTIEDTVKSELESVLRGLADMLLHSTLAGLDAPVRFAVPVPFVAGGPPEVEMLMGCDGVRGYATAGVGLSAGLRVTATKPAPGTTNVFVAHDAPVTPAVLGPEPFGVVVTPDALHALGHALWRAGALQFAIDPANPSTTMPGGTLNLEARFLYPFIPSVRDLAPDPRTPISIKASLACAPQLVLGKNPAAPIGIEAGEVELTIGLEYLDGQPAVELFTLRAAVALEAAVAVDATMIRVTGLNLASMRVDVVREPTVDLPDQEIEDFVAAIAPDLAKRFTVTIPPIPVPALPLGLKLKSPRLVVTPETLTFMGDL